jgi:hypothetical protein
MACAMFLFKGDNSLNANSKPYQVIDFVPGHRIWLNTLDLSWTPHAIYGFLEVDMGMMIEGKIGKKKALMWQVSRHPLY